MGDTAWLTGRALKVHEEPPCAPTAGDREMGVSSLGERSDWNRGATVPD